MDGMGDMIEGTDRLSAPPQRLVERQLQLTSAKIRAYGSLTEDPNPIHYDAAFAAKTSFGKPIAHGTFTLNALWAAVTATFGADALGGMIADLRFIKPVIENDTVTAYGELVTRTPPSYRVAIVDSAGAKVVEGQLSWPVSGAASQ
jgi:3-hydroxybutyryl-CoA dehydratase